MRHRLALTVVRTMDGPPEAMHTPARAGIAQLPSGARHAPGRRLGHLVEQRRDENRWTARLFGRTPPVSAAFR